MLRERKISIVQYSLIVLLWVFAYCVPVLFNDDSTINWMPIYQMWMDTSVMFFIFLLNRFFLSKRFFFKKRYVTYLIVVLVILTLVQLYVIYLKDSGLISQLMGDDHTPPMRSRPPMGSRPPVHHPITVVSKDFSLMIFSLLVILLDLGFSIAMKWLVNEQRQSELQSKNIRAQLSNLQSQVSPHFFMNTLNNIHALVGIDPQKAQETIIELSGLMDYLLYECSTSKNVSLQREVDFTKSYVNLMRLRFPKKVVIEFLADEEMPQVSMPPLLFLNFIENAFKYGVNYSKDSYIRIKIKSSHKSIVMEVANTNHSESVKSTRKGLGISNSRSRLDLIYGDNYKLEICDSEQLYSVYLKIPIL